MKLFWEIIFSLRNIIAGLPVVFALVSTKWEWENESGIWAMALCIGTLGVCMRAWAACHCHYGQGKKKGLATTGPYAYVRNPLYIGNTLILMAATVASELEWLLPGTAVWALIVYNGAVYREEAVLRQRYGAKYTKYCSETPRWIPSLGSFSNRRFLSIILRESFRLIILVPFVLKELNVFNLW